jgi:hypothetical protein
MTVTETRCAGPLCSRPVRARLDGAAGPVLLAGCRQAAYRDRVRQAEAEQQHLARLADSEAARLWRPPTDAQRPPSGWSLP